MAKPKPKGWNAMSKAKQDAWKKANFDSSTKVTTAQLDKLRAEKTPEKAIAKYKNDPAMREALNRFYGKSRVGSVTATTPPSSGPGSKMPGRPAGGPGAKTGGDGRVKKTAQVNPGRGNTRGPANAGVGPNKSKSPNVSATGVALAGAAALAVAKGRGGPGAKPNRAITQGLKQIEAGPKGKADMAAAKQMAAAKAKAKASKGKMTDRPSNSGRAATATAGRHKAAKAGVKSKMKAQGARIASSAGSRYTSRGKK